MKGLIYALALGEVLIGLAVAWGFYAIDQGKRDARTSTCAAFINQYEIFARQIGQGEKLAASLAYYREHPKEYRLVLQASQHELVELHKTIPSYCGGPA